MPALHNTDTSKVPPIVSEAHRQRGLTVGPYARGEQFSHIVVQMFVQIRARRAIVDHTSIDGGVRRRGK